MTVLLYPHLLVFIDQELPMKHLLLPIFLLSTSLSAMTIYPTTAKATKGSISDQDLSVLSIEDQQEVQNEWDNYLEISASNNKSVVKFKFNAPQEAQTCTNAKFHINSMGEPNSNEKWEISIRNYQEQQFKTLTQNGDNDWTWEKQSVEIGEPTPYINTNNKMLIKIKCKNRCTVEDIDYMAISFEDCNSGQSTPNPNMQSKISIGKTYNLQYNQTDNLITDGYDLIDIDVEDTSAAQIASLKKEGKTVLCYINTGAYEEWRSDANSFDTALLGKNMSGWAGEKWLDISNLDLLLPIMSARFERAKEKGCDAIHPDNIDGYSNDSGFTLTANDQLLYNKMIAKLAHDNGMLIGLKNSVAQIDDLVHDFDFAINESCYIYEECSGYSAFISANKPVYIIEYDIDVFTSNQEDAKQNQFSMIHKNRNLDAYVRSISNT